MLDISVFNENIRNVVHQYENKNSKRYLKISNTVSSLTLIGDSTDNQLSTKLMKSASLGNKITTIGDKCFFDCTNLSTVYTSENLVNVGASAFMNCEKLYYIDIFDEKRKTPLQIFGNSAFENTGLQHVIINGLGGKIDADNDYSTLGTRSFYGCKDLRSVKFTKSNNYGDESFAECSALTSVTFADNHSYQGVKVFKNCISLKNVTIPKSMWMLSPYMFQGCNHLENVNIVSNSDLKFVSEHVFDGCSRLKTLTLPASITSFDQINSAAFYGSNLTQIVFDGIPSSTLFYQQQTSKTITIDLTKVHKPTTVTKLEELFMTAYSSTIPIVVIYGNLDGGCSNCVKLDKQMNTSEFKEYMSTAGYLFLQIEARTYRDIASRIKSLASNYYKSGCVGGDYPTVSMLYKDSTKTVATKKIEYDGKASQFIQLLNEQFAGCSTGQSGQIEAILSPNADGWGLSTTCEFISAADENGQRSTGVFNGYLKTYSYTTGEKIDYYITDDFRFGQWHGNLPELLAYSETKKCPVFIEIGSESCGPCQDFQTNVFSNPDFQLFAKTTKMLLGRHLYKNESEDTIMTGAKTKLRLNSAPPHVIVYWKEKNINTTAYYDPEEPNSDLKTLDDVKNYINNYLAPYYERSDIAFSPMTPDGKGDPNARVFAKELRVLIPGRSTQSTELSDYSVYSQNKMSYYPNIENDLTANYFVTETKTIDNSSYTVEIVDADGNWTNTYQNIQTGMELTSNNTYPCKAGTYKYLTVPVNDQYNDREGILFKLDYMDLTSTNKVSTKSSIPTTGWTLVESTTLTDPEEIEDAGYVYKAKYKNNTQKAEPGQTILTYIEQFENPKGTFIYELQTKHNNHFGVKYLYKFNSMAIEN